MGRSSIGALDRSAIWQLRRNGRPGGDHQRTPPSARYLKMLFGIIAWTPLVPSTA